MYKRGSPQVVMLKHGVAAEATRKVARGRADPNEATWDGPALAQGQQRKTEQVLVLCVMTRPSAPQRDEQEEGSRRTPSENWYQNEKREESIM